MKLDISIRMDINMVYNSELQSKANTGSSSKTPSI